MINVPLMRKVLEHISEHPEEHDQGTWAERTACGTTMCMAGHAVVMAGHQISWPGTLDDESSADFVTEPIVVDNETTRRIPAVAAHELGLTEEQKDAFFYESGTIEDLWREAHIYTDGEIEIPEQYQYQYKEIV